MKRSESQTLGLVDGAYQGGNTTSGLNPSVVDSQTFEGVVAEVANLQEVCGVLPKTENNQLGNNVPYLGRKTLSVTGTENLLLITEPSIGSLVDNLTFEIISPVTTGDVVSKIQINNFGSKDLTRNLSSINSTSAIFSAGGRYILKYSKSVDKFLITNFVSVENTLASVSAFNALSSNQGNILDSRVSSNTNKLNNLQTTVDNIIDSSITR